MSSTSLLRISTHSSPRNSSPRHSLHSASSSNNMKQKFADTPLASPYVSSEEEPSPRRSPTRTPSPSVSEQGLGYFFQTPLAIEVDNNPSPSPFPPSPPRAAQNAKQAQGNFLTKSLNLFLNDLKAPIILQVASNLFHSHAFVSFLNKEVSKTTFYAFGGIGTLKSTLTLLEIIHELACRPDEEKMDYVFLSEKMVSLLSSIHIALAGFSSFLSKKLQEGAPGIFSTALIINCLSCIYETLKTLMAEGKLSFNKESILISLTFIKELSALVALCDGGIGNIIENAEHGKELTNIQIGSSYVSAITAFIEFCFIIIKK